MLRPTERDDVPCLWELLADIEVATLSDDGPVFPRSLTQYLARFDKSLEEDPRTSVWFAVEADDEIVGESGLYAIDLFSRRCELGISLGRPFWGRGLGTDAVRVTVDYAFDHLDMNRVGLRALADDERAVGAYRRAGFTVEGRLRQHSRVRTEWHDDIVMSILRSDRQDTGSPTG
jgi:RimJ/RimL family protein N-acetyltransferase